MVVGLPFQDFLYAELQDVQVERFCDIVVGTVFQTCDNIVFGRFGGKHDYRDMGVVDVGLDTVTKFQTVHLGHHNITDDNVHLVAVQHLERLDAIAGSEHMILVVETALEEHAEVLVVFNNEDGGHFFLWACRGRQRSDCFLGCFVFIYRRRG